MAGNVLVKVSKEKDFRVIIDKDHYNTAAVVNKASRLLGLIKNCFTNLSTDTFTKLYKSISDLKITICSHNKYDLGSRNGFLPHYNWLQYILKEIPDVTQSL